MMTFRVISDIIVDTVIIAVAAYLLWRVVRHIREAMIDHVDHTTSNDQIVPGIWDVLADVRRITEESAGGTHGATG